MHKILKCTKIWNAKTHKIPSSPFCNMPLSEIIIYVFIYICIIILEKKHCELQIGILNSIYLDTSLVYIEIYRLSIYI